MATSMIKSSVVLDKLLLQGKNVYFANYCCVSSSFLSKYTLIQSAHGNSLLRLYSNVPSQQKITNSETGSPASISSSASVNLTASDRFGHIMQMYEDLVGLTEVKTAQDNVLDAERNFLKVQEDRRTLQLEISEIQAEVRSVASELEKTHRTDPNYIDLIKKEHGILVKEKEMATQLKTLDRCERDLFSHLSMFVRESHEKERARAERTKYWSVIGSIVGAIIGIAGSTINNHRRLKELRSIVKESGESTAEYKEIADRILAGLSSYPVIDDVNANSNNSNINTKPLHEKGLPDSLQSEMFQQWTETFHDHLNLRTSEILSSLVDIKKLVAVTHNPDENPNIVYVGPEMKSMLQETELKLEQNANKNLMVSLSVICGIFTVGLSFIAFIFKGS